MSERPPYDRDSPPPGGFDPRLGGRRDAGQGNDRGPDPRFRRGEDDRYGYGQRREPREERMDPFDRGEPPRSPPPPQQGRSRSSPNRWLLIIGGLLLLGAVLFGLSLTRGGAGSDAVGGEGDNEQEAAAADPETRCAAPATYELIKRELFRQAAATRGSDQAAFDRLAAYAALRVSNPVLREQDEGLERVSCQAEAALDLPPGVQVVGGRRTLTANLGYSLQPAADSSGDVVSLTGAEGIVVPLATLARTGEATPADATGNVQQPDLGVPVAPGAPPPPEAPQPGNASPDQTPPPPAAVPPSANVRPSFNCANARTRGEVAVCNSPELAALDRQMANFYQTAFRGSDADTRRLLERTRNRFLTFRDRCRNDACVADSYRGRISEIRDIVDGRWRGN
ncbi:hypothetical protein [Sphingomonas sp. LHG3406-1]|uniref:lysozyme inhibitor LprI family protein n=1 Tax=Sphingomonas sp. LHG3406-1 TaxID=2804617 RepID=UPI002635C267|nr:hypothetical protein [Sphingomonas sp. LHG3406-1]